MSTAKAFRRGLLGAALTAAISSLGGHGVLAQTYGLATMQPGTLANTVASAIAKTLKEKGGLNTLVQATAGEIGLIPMVAHGEIDLGMANMLEVVEGIETGKLQNDLRIIGSIFVLRSGFFARKDSGIVSVADLKGKRVPAGYSAMRTRRQELIGDAGNRRSHAERHQARDGAERAARRRRFHGRFQRRIHVLVRRPEGARSRRHRRRRARDQAHRYTGWARGKSQDIPLRLLHRNQADSRPTSALASR